MKVTNKRSNKKTTLYIIIILIVLSIILGINSNVSKIELMIKDALLSINFPYSYLLKEKNSNNLDESTIIIKEKNKNLEKEIEELKKQLDLNNTQTGYDIENATVLSKNKGYYLNTLTIDKGSNDGIKKDMAVIDKNGLIGKISLVTKNFSEVKLLTSNDKKYKISISIKVNNQDNYAILNGFDNEKQLLKVTGVNKMIAVKKGDTIVTSGIGNLFPAGIYIGKVEEVINDKYDLSKSLLIKTDIDFNGIHYVSVLKEKN